MERVLKSKYKIQNPIAENSWTTTYKGQVLSTGQLVAIKIYRRSFLDNFLIKKLADKAKSLATLEDPHIARLLDGDYGWQGFFFVREYVEGYNLAELLQNKKVLDIDQIIGITTSLCNALCNAHKNGFVHGNLNPYNVIITSEGFSKITDFGIDNSIRSSFYQRARQVLNNPYFLSPEQVQGIPTTFSSDIYNVGTLLYLMLTGTMPFKNGSPIAVAIKKIKEMPTPPSSLNPKIPSYLEEITLKALETDPLLRFGSIDEMRNCLNEKAILVKTTELGLANHPYNGVNMNGYRQDEEDVEGKRFRFQFPQDSKIKSRISYFLYLAFGVLTAILLGYGIVRMVLR